MSETDYQSVKHEYKSDQVLLTDYSDSEKTRIAVVSKPGGSGIEEYCDEHWPELGMPEYAHNKAFEDANLEAIYRKHLDTDEAEARLREAEMRLNSGEDLTFVCFEGEGERCHRHILLDVLRERRSSESKFTFVR